MFEIEWLGFLLKWIFDRAARMRLVGYRPEIICLIKDIGKKDRYLLTVPEIDHFCWTPPQEGFHPNDTPSDAAKRCLRVELGIDETKIQLRKTVWLAKRKLPQDRWDERDLPYSLGRWISGARMIGKAYFAVLILVDASTAVRPNPAEIYKWEWVDTKEFHKRIETNHPDKIEILQNAWRKLLGEG